MHTQRHKQLWLRVDFDLILGALWCATPVQAQRYARKAMKDSASSEHVNPRVWKMFSEASAQRGEAWEGVANRCARW